MGFVDSYGKKVHTNCQPDTRYRKAMGVEYLDGQGFVRRTGQPVQSHLSEDALGFRNGGE